MISLVPNLETVSQLAVMVVANLSWIDLELYVDKFLHIYI